jgi:hypothetical protein
MVKNIVMGILKDKPEYIIIAVLAIMVMGLTLGLGWVGVENKLLIEKIFLLERKVELLEEQITLLEPDSLYYWTKSGPDTFLTKWYWPGGHITTPKPDTVWNNTVYYNQVGSLFICPFCYTKFKDYHSCWTKD